MPAAETQSLRGRDDGELRADLEAAHQSLFNLRFQAATRQLADNSQVHKARRRVARIKTLMRERDILARADAAASERGEA
ncbi:MAG: 50S ribosomal protein L29 [Dehalococcoidia bacterium]